MLDVVPFTSFGSVSGMFIRAHGQRGENHIYGRSITQNGRAISIQRASGINLGPNQHDMSVNGVRCGFGVVFAQRSDNRAVPRGDFYIIGIMQRV